MLVIHKFRGTTYGRLPIACFSFLVHRSVQLYLTLPPDALCWCPGDVFGRAISCANPCAIFKISSCYVVSVFIISYSLESQQTVDKSKKNPEALISQSFGIWYG